MNLPMRAADLFKKYRETINPPYNKNNLLVVWATLFLLLAVPLTVISILQVREPTSRAETIPNDLLYRIGWQWNLDKIRSPAAWDITTGRSDVVIAVLGTGVDKDHVDFAGKLVPGYNTVSNSTFTDDTNQGFGSGTVLAGIAAAATNNSIGIAGISWNSMIMPLTVCSTTMCEASDLAEGIRWAADNGADVIVTRGWESTNPSSDVESAVNYASGLGVLIVSGSGDVCAGCNIINYPARYSNVIAVGRTDQSDIVDPQSGRGPGLDITAPGTSVYSTKNFGDYIQASGTPAAAAHVSGALALLLSKGVTPANAVQALYNGAVDLGPAGRDDTYGWGRLDACGALNVAGFTCPVTGGGDTLPPTVNITNPTNGQIISGTVNVNVNATDN